MSRNAHNNKDGKNGKNSPTIWKRRNKLDMWQKWEICQNRQQLRRGQEANANEKTRGAPWKAGEFGEFANSGENGKFVKIANNSRGQCK